MYSSNKIIIIIRKPDDRSHAEYIPHSVHDVWSAPTCLEFFGPRGVHVHASISLCIFVDKHVMHVTTTNNNPAT